MEPIVQVALNRVCIVMLSTLGGVVRTMPVVNAIKRARPSCRISWVIQPGAATALEGVPSVDEVILFERSRGPAGFVDVRRRLRRGEYDVTLALQSYLKAGLITSFARSPVKLGLGGSHSRDANWLFTTHRVHASAPQHAQDDYLDFARAVGVDPEPPEWNLTLSEAERAWQRDFFATTARPVVAIVAATTLAAKDWPAERMARLCDALWFDHGLEPVLVGGESERELRAKAVAGSLCRRAPRSALGSGLRRLLAILDGSALVVSPDTGPLHAAIALGRPVISLCGYMNPKRFGPYRRCHDLLVDAFGDPGEDYTADAPPRPNRMERITVQDVLDRVDVWRRSYATSMGPKA